MIYKFCNIFRLLFFIGVFCTDRAMYQMETEELSTATGGVCFPRSIPYYTIKSALSRTGIPESPVTKHIQRMTEEGIDMNKIGITNESNSRCMDELCKQLRENRLKYNKQLKRLAQLPVTSIGQADRIEIFSIWYEQNALLEIYEMLRVCRLRKLRNINEVTKSPISKELNNAINTIRCLPLSTPINKKCSIPQFLQPEWLHARIKDIFLFNEALQTRTKVACETIIARVALKEVVKRLKHCAQRQKSGENSEDLTKEWINAFKLYRCIWSCLNMDSETKTSVSFVYK